MYCKKKFQNNKKNVHDVRQLRPSTDLPTSPYRRVRVSIHLCICAYMTSDLYYL